MQGTTTLRKSDKVTALSSDPPMLLARLEYAASGWQTFPAPPDGSKKSLKWQDKYGTRWGHTDDEDIIRKEFKSRRFKEQNIGIATGAISGIFVIEVDTAEHGKDVDGAAALKAWEKTNDKLPATLMARSPSGSVHRYFRHPGEGFKVKSFNAILGAGSGVDCKGDGGMVIGPPSYRPPAPGKAGGVYKWINPGHSIAKAPAALLDLVIEKPEAPKAPEARSEQNEFQRLNAGNGWAKAALHEECQILRNTLDGELNRQLNSSVESRFKIRMFLRAREALLSQRNAYHSALIPGTSARIFCSSSSTKLLSRHALGELVSNIRHLTSFSCKACFSRSASICISLGRSRKVQPRMRA